MENPPPLEEVYHAINALYNDPNSQEKEKASNWLGKLQKSIYSWKISDELLHQKRNLECCYFGAQTMRTKIQQSFRELPEDSHVSLKNSLLEHISQITPNTNFVIINQLCLALADLALQMDQWKMPVTDLIENFAAANVWAVIEILTFIAEEVMYGSLRLGANRRNEVRKYLSLNATIVNEFLTQTLSNSGNNTQISIKVIKCLTSWISLKAININDLGKNAVLAHAFQVLGDQSTCGRLHEAAADCVCGLLKCLEDSVDNQDIELITFNSIAALEPCYHLAVAQEDQERALNFTRIFTELAESFLDKIITFTLATKQSHFAMTSFDLVLVCVGHHDYEIANISYNLWCRLSDELYKKDNDELTSIFKPYVERLIAALLRHCQMEPDHQGLLNKDEEFYEFRRKVLELTRDIIFVIGSIHCFKQLFMLLQAPNITWEYTEAVLYIMQAIAKNIIPNEYEVVPKVVEAILNMPENAHVAVRYTSILLLGQLCDWIQQQSQCLEATLECLLRALHDTSLASAAAHALQDICSACREKMCIHLSGLLQIVHSLDSLSLSNEASIALLRGVAAIIGHLPHDQITMAMREACSVQVTGLANLTSNNVNKDSSTDPALWLDRLTALLRYCKITIENGQTHPCLPVLSDSWSVLSSVLERYSGDLRVMERLCRCLRFALRSLGSQGSFLLEPLSKQMVATYMIHRHSCFLYLASIMVDELASNPVCVPSLMEMLQALIGPSFELLQQPGGLHHNPDTVDDLFRLCLRFLQRLPFEFVRSTAVTAVLHCGILACSLDHRDANSSVMKFLCDFVMTGQQKSSHQQCIDSVNCLLSEHGEDLVNSLIYASVFSIHSYMLSDVADVLLQLLIWDKNTTSGWLESALYKLPQNTNSATEAQLKNFHCVVSGSKSTKPITNALRDFTRLYY